VSPRKWPYAILYALAATAAMITGAVRDWAEGKFREEPDAGDED
jgi:hypothetical protein